MEAEKRIKKLNIILLMAVISVVGAMVWVNGGFEKGGILHLGEVYKVPKEMLSMGTDSCSYNVETKEYVAQMEAAELYFNVNSTNRNWKYCVVNIKAQNYSSLSAKIDFIGKEQKELFTLSTALRSGKNILNTPVQGEVETIRLTFYSQIGTRFRISGLQIRQKYFDSGDFLYKVITIFLASMVCYIVISAGKRMEWYLIIDIMQNFFVYMGDTLGKRISAVFCERCRKKIQTACFSVMFLLTIVVNVVNETNDSKTAGYYWTMIFGAFFLVIGLLSYGVPLKKQSWRTGECFVWLLLWGMTAVSDLFVFKSIPYVGYVMVVCGGFACFVWWSREEFLDTFYRMLRGLEWTLPFITVYCLIFRPKKIGILYNGCFPQRESMSMYALGLLIAFLIEGKAIVCQKEFNWRKFFVFGVGTSFSCFFLYYSDTSWCNIVAIIVLFLWAADLLYRRSGWRANVKKLFVTGIIALFYALILIIGVKYLLKELSGSLGTELIYENEIQETKLTDEELWAIEAQQPGYIEDVVRANDQSRMDVWLQYVQKLNIVGNIDNLRIDDHYRNPSNGIIQVAYRYGMFILVPYLGFLILGIYRAWKKRSFLWTAIVLSFAAGIMLGDLEIPYAQPLWFMFYLGIGQFFYEEKA